MDANPQSPGEGRSLVFGNDYLETTYHKPKMNLYGVYEESLDRLSDIGVIANVCLGICSGTATAALSCLLGELTVTGATAGALCVLTIFFTAISITTGLLTRHQFRSETREIDRIKKNVVTYEPKRSSTAE